MKHGPKTILLKLLTILLSGSPCQWWTRQQLTAGLIRRQSQLRRSTLPARHRFRAISAKIAGRVGTNQFQMFATVSIKKNSRGNKDQVISSRNAATAAGRRAPGPGLMKSQATSKSQAASVKLSNQPGQLTSGKHPNHNHKRQASSLKLQAH